MGEETVLKNRGTMKSPSKERGLLGAAEISYEGRGVAEGPQGEDSHLGKAKGMAIISRKEGISLVYPCKYSSNIYLLSVPSVPGTAPDKALT